MAHAPVTLPHDLMRELTDGADARARSDENAAEPCYRSEALAEDLDGAEPVPEGDRLARGGWWSTAPLGVALAGALVAVLGGRG